MDTPEIVFQVLADVRTEDQEGKHRNKNLISDRDNAADLYITCLRERETLL